MHDTLIAALLIALAVAPAFTALKASEHMHGS